LGTKKDGTKTASFAVIRPTDYIGVLVEVAYMTNPIDSLLYTKEDFPRETAKAIAEGILDFLKRE
jgi:N-acetylmuramoyl-L-alanine amidase